ncbi:hypothetical protein CBOM_04391 [Ceraceosorus bombacis]|uniref:LCCL domain-containing protein n=1 Tax=Ceraceosorus bombacis TaxID=401625 RepID=A0A0P1BIG8_9BASI|nr:hypothetical protein CBOM_04391 [Ceraceosorus bombacis]
MSDRSQQTDSRQQGGADTDNDGRILRLQEVISTLRTYAGLDAAGLPQTATVADRAEGATRLLIGSAWEEIEERRGGRWNIPGVKPLLSALQNELRACQSSTPPTSSNAPHLIAQCAALMQEATSHVPIAGVNVSFPAPIDDGAVLSGSSSKAKSTAKVDVVSDGGGRWVRIVGIRPSALLQEWRVMDEASDSRAGSEMGSDGLDQVLRNSSISKLTQELVRAKKAAIDQHALKKDVQIVLKFTHLPLGAQDSSMSAMQEDMGLSYPSPEAKDRFLSRLSALRSAILREGILLEKGEPTWRRGLLPPPALATPARISKAVAVDLSALVALISDMTHMALPPNDELPFIFSSDGIAGPSIHGRALIEQAEREGVDALFNNFMPESECIAAHIEELWCTAETKDKVMDIVEKIGGTAEKARGQALFVEDAEAAHSAFWKGSRWSKAGALRPRLPLPIRVLGGQPSWSRQDSRPFAGLSSALQLPPSKGSPTSHTLNTLDQASRAGMTTFTTNIWSATWVSDKVPYETLDADTPAIMWVLHPRSLSERMRSGALRSGTGAKSPRDSIALATPSVDQVSTPKASLPLYPQSAWGSPAVLYDASGSRSDNLSSKERSSLLDPAVASSAAVDRTSASASRRGAGFKILNFLDGPHPRSRLFIRHYRWWPFASVESKWTKFTSPVAWRAPDTPSLLPDASQSKEGAGMGLEWKDHVKREWRLNWKHWLLLVAVLIAWVLGFAYLVKGLWYESRVTLGSGQVLEPDFYGCTSTFWLGNAQCGVDGESCAPFASNSSVPFRCPAGCAGTTLGSARAVGSELPNFVPLIVGGGDNLVDGRRVYRADSFVCAAAQHAGVIDGRTGGCGTLWLGGASTSYESAARNGLTSIGFNSTFPVSFFFDESAQQSGCHDTRERGYALNVALLAFVAFVLRPKRIVYFWILVCTGFWHINMLSEPRAYPPKVGGPVGDFLPTLFGAYVIWRVAVRYVWPAFERLPIEREIWTLGFFWIGTMLNVVFANVPLQRLVASDIASQPGALTALIVIIVVVIIIVVNQIRVIRKVGALPKYLALAVVGGIIVGLCAAVPTTGLRLHHYIIALVLVCFCAFPTRLSLIYVAFCLGMYLNGVGRWGFDPIATDIADIVGDGTFGTGLPSFASAQNWTGLPGFGPSANATGMVQWDAIPGNQTDSWDGFHLLVDDVLRYAGEGTSFNMTSLIDDYAPMGNSGMNTTLYPGGSAALNATLASQPHYLRLAFTSQGSPGDYTRAAIAYFNGSWTPAPEGAT